MMSIKRYKGLVKCTHMVKSNGYVVCGSGKPITHCYLVRLAYDTLLPIPPKTKKDIHHFLGLRRYAQQMENADACTYRL